MLTEACRTPHRSLRQCRVTAPSESQFPRQISLILAGNVSRDLSGPHLMTTNGIIPVAAGRLTLRRVEIIIAKKNSERARSFLSLGLRHSERKWLSCAPRNFSGLVFLSLWNLSACVDSSVPPQRTNAFALQWMTRRVR